MSPRSSWWRRGPDTAINGRGQGDIIGVCLTDVLGDGLSMVYSFFDPDLAGRSLGARSRPSGQLADYLEGVNAAGPGFESRAVNAAFNDRIVLVDANP